MILFSSTLPHIHLSHLRWKKEKHTEEIGENNVINKSTAPGTNTSASTLEPHLPFLGVVGSEAGVGCWGVDMEGMMGAVSRQYSMLMSQRAWRMESTR